MIKRLAVLAAPLLVLAAADPASADDDRKHRHHRNHGHWQGHHHKHHWHGDRHRHSSASIVFWSGPAYRPYYPPPPVVYGPPPPPRVVYAPAPVVYAPQVAAVPTRDFRDDEGRYCREYQRTAIIDGREQQIYGTACLMPDGAWRIVAE